MFLTKIKVVAAAIVGLVAFVGIGGGLVARQGAALADAPTPAPKTEPRADWKTEGGSC